MSTENIWEDIDCEEKAANKNNRQMYFRQIEHSQVWSSSDPITTNDDVPFSNVLTSRRRQTKPADQRSGTTKWN